MTSMSLNHVPVFVRDLGPDVEQAEVLWVADLHIGAELFDSEGWKHLLARLKGDPNRLVILGGDLLEAATKESKSDVYKAKFPPQKEMEQVIEDLEPFRKQIIAVIGGNHEERIWRATGVDPLAWVCRELEVPYARNGTFIRLKLGRALGESRKVRNPLPVSYTIYAGHGWSGGRRPGAVVNALQELSMAIIADVYLLGHTHRPLVFTEQRVYVNPQTETAQVRQVWFVSCGSLLRWGDYAQRQGRVPLPGVMPVVVFDGRHKNTVKVILDGN